MKPLLVIVLALVLLLTAYIAGYFTLGERSSLAGAFPGMPPLPPTIIIRFDSGLLADTYAPAAAVEGLFRGMTVRTYYCSPESPEFRLLQTGTGDSADSDAENSDLPLPEDELQ